MSDESNKTNEILDALPRKSLEVKRNEATLNFPAALGKKGDWQNIPFYKPDVKNVPLEQLVKWAGEKFVRQVLGQRLTLIAQEAMWRATHRTMGKDKEGNDIEEPKELDLNVLEDTLSNLKVSGLTLKGLNDELNELLEELSSAAAELEAAQASGDPAVLMAKMQEWVATSKEINNIQAEIKNRKRPRGESEQE